MDRFVEGNSLLNKRSIESSKLVVIIEKILRVHRVYLLLGSNKGDRRKYLLLAQYFLSSRAGRISAVSAVYETEPWGKAGQARYLNQALEIQTELSPFRLLRLTQQIEKKLGRTNKHLNAARIIDIDILFYDDAVLKAKNLEVPHPRLHLRNFTLQPLQEIAAGYTHPVLGRSISELAKACADTGKVSIFKPSGNKP